MKIIVSDASSLILSERIKLLDKCIKSFKIQIPQKVFKEVVIKGKEKQAPDAYSIEKKIEQKLITVKNVENNKEVKRIMKEFGIAQGETEAIALFMEEKASFVLLDDHKAINACKSYKIPFITTLTMILLSHETKQIKKDMAIEMIKNLGIHGRYKNELIFKALEEVEK